MGKGTGLQSFNFFDPLREGAGLQFLDRKGAGKGLPVLGTGAVNRRTGLRGARELDALGATAEVAVGVCGRPTRRSTF